MTEQVKQISNIYQRFHEVMKAVEYIQKESRKVNNQYTFVSCESVIEKVRPELVKQGIVTLVDVVSHSQDGNRTEAEVRITFVNIDNPDDRFSVSSFGYGIDSQDKGPGKAVSYGHKYALLKSLNIPTGDDPERDMVDYQPSEPVSDPVQDLMNLLKTWQPEINQKLQERCLPILSNGHFENSVRKYFRDKNIVLDHALISRLQGNKQEFLRRFTDWRELRNREAMAETFPSDHIPAEPARKTA